MAISAPLKITLYDENDEPKAEYICQIIRSRFLKKAIELQGLQFKEKITADEADAIAGLIVDVFHNKFTVDQFWDDTSLTEAFAVINSIVARAERLFPNPPTQGK